MGIYNGGKSHFYKIFFDDDDGDDDDDDDVKVRWTYVFFWAKF